ncbi:MAG: hypothetical protein QW708_03645 [Desulfurococcaceae archaeon]
MKAKTDYCKLETNIEGTFVTGDGVGLSRGINVVATTGILAARAISGVL